MKKKSKPSARFKIIDIEIIRAHKRLIIAGVVGFWLIIGLYFFWGLPNPMQLTTRPAAVSTKLMDRNGNLIYEIFADERRTPIQISTLPKYVWEATIAAEDQDFYNHSGFSVRGITRAFMNTFFKRNLQGGSTITQQLVKKALLSDERTWRRKVREFALSLVVEIMYKKDQILEMYLNQIGYGGTAYGLESAARTYFNKSSTELTLAEAALLAGLPQAPSYYSPFGSRPELSLERQKYVLDQMLQSKFISQEEHDTALSEELVFSTPQTLKAPHFSLWVRDQLIEKYGLDKVEREGLTVTTSLDLDLQTFAQDTVATEVGKLKSARVGNGAVLSTNPKTGEILAMVGSKDYFNTAEDGNVNVTLAYRQPGSSIKPINYAIGIDRKLFTAATVLADKPTCFAIPGQKEYCPVNYDGAFHGPTQVRFALGNSFNIPAVKALVINGLEEFVASASAFGFSTFKDPKDYGPSITLGGGEVTMLDLATGFSVLANAGQKTTLNPILQIQNREGKVIEQAPLREISAEEAEELKSYQKVTIGDQHYLTETASNTRVIAPGTAYIVSHLLLDNGARSAAFGSNSLLNVRNHPEVSVKTGTTNDKRDNWTIGYNPDILTAVWVGNNDNSPMGNVASGVTGASPIWNKVMTYALADLPQKWPVQPPDVVGSLVCSLSGFRAPEGGSDGCSPRYEYFLRGTIPPFASESRRDIYIYKPTQAPATTKQISDEPTEVEMQNHAVIFDPLGSMLCLDCAGGYGEGNLIRLDARGKAIRN
jgi:membrane carboxypeptidase/penicillin-binding protein